MFESARSNLLNLHNKFPPASQVVRLGTTNFLGTSFSCSKPRPRFESLTFCKDPRTGCKLSLIYPYNNPTISPQFSQNFSRISPNIQLMFSSGHLRRRTSSRNWAVKLFFFHFRNTFPKLRRNLKDLEKKSAPICGWNHFVRWRLVVFHPSDYENEPSSISDRISIREWISIIYVPYFLKTSRTIIFGIWKW